jgi:hypothetical protein
MSLFPVPNPSYTDLVIAQIQTFSQSPLFRAAAKSWAYYSLQAYDPRFGLVFNSPYADWNEDVDGKRPACQPTGRIIIDSGAEFLFGDCPHWTVPDSEELESLLQDILDQNDVEAMLLPLARQAGNEGSVWAKFAWTPDVAGRPVAISWLSPYEVTAYRDPLDKAQIRKIRVHQKFQDDSDGKWYLYREDWTAELYTVYRRLVTREQDDNEVIGQFVKGEWPIESTEPNRFRMLPFVQIYNKRVASETDGLGDIWDCYDLINRVSHTYWLADRSNQWDGDPITAIINATSAPDRVYPGDLLRLSGDPGVDIKRLTPENNLRQWMKQFADDEERYTLDACGSDRINPAEITNMGKMTRAVMELIFHRSLKSCNEKRGNWGRKGLEPFFERMFLALSRLPDARALLPALSVVNGADTDSYDVVTKWPPFFEVTPEERTSTLGDLVTAMGNGLLTRERAIEIAATLFGVDDVETLKQELADWQPPAMEEPSGGEQTGGGASSGQSAA